MDGLADGPRDGSVEGSADGHCSLASFGRCQGPVEDLHWPSIGLGSRRPGLKKDCIGYLQSRAVNDLD